MIVAVERIAPESLPDEPAVCSVTLAELAAGPHATADQREVNAGLIDGRGSGD